MTGPQLEEFREDLLEACWRVARASGGLLNVAFNISANEKRIIAIERALTM